MQPVSPHGWFARDGLPSAEFLLYNLHPGQAQTNTFADACAAPLTGREREEKHEDYG